jgi:hypothetical protein
MTTDDGAAELLDGSGSRANMAPKIAPLNEELFPSPKHLWVVRTADVVHAAEACAFGATRDAGTIKHTNLTGGEPAFSGGEFVQLDGNTLVVSGDSGRYGPRTAEEMLDVSLAFRDAGYTVYSTGYDEEVNRAFPLVGRAPRLI